MSITLKMKTAQFKQLGKKSQALWYENSLVMMKIFFSKAAERLKNFQKESNEASINVI